MQGETRQSWRTNLFYSRAYDYENESTFGHELNLDESCFDLSKDNSNFSSIYGFRKSVNFKSHLICDI